MTRLIINYLPCRRQLLRTITANHYAVHFIQYAFMCLYIGLYLYFQWIPAPLPAFWSSLNSWVSWGFLLWGGFSAGRVMVDCLRLSLQQQMSAANAWNGVLLAVLHFLPVLGMSLFMLKQGFATK